MRVVHLGGDRQFQFSQRDTERWAERWPCSTLRGHRVAATFDFHGDLVDLSVDGRSDDDTIDGYELLCLVDDVAPAREHPATMES